MKIIGVYHSWHYLKRNDGKPPPLQGEVGVGMGLNVAKGPIPILALYVSFCWTRLSFLLVNAVWPGTAARPALGTPSPWGSKERRAGFSLITRTVAWANKPAFLQGWVP